MAVYIITGNRSTEGVNEGEDRIEEVKIPAEKWPC